MNQAVIPADDRGFLFGDSIFEVFVAFGTTILDAKAHIDRLRYSAQKFLLDIPWRDEELLFELKGLLEHLAHKKSYLRLVITRGSGLGLVAKDQLSPNKIIYCLPAQPQPDEVYEKGLTLKKCSKSYTSRGQAAKTSNYIDSIHAIKKAKAEGFDEILWINSEHEITEAATANVFLLAREGDLIEIATPPPSSGLLLGITRERIIHLLESASIKVTERIITAEEIARFDEGFICSTVRGLVPIRKIDQHKLYTTRKNSVFRHINRLFLTWVASEVGQRVDWNTGYPVNEEEK